MDYSVTVAFNPGPSSHMPAAMPALLALNACLPPFRVHNMSTIWYGSWTVAPLVRSSPVRPLVDALNLRLESSMLCQTLLVKSNAMEAQWAAQTSGDKLSENDQLGGYGHRTRLTRSMTIFDCACHSRKLYVRAHSNCLQCVN
jgi:hypothetical protein